MIVGVYGAGYVGLVTAVCLSKLGHEVICADIDEERIAQLNKGQCPIYEKHLPDLIKEQLSEGRLLFTSVLNQVTQMAEVHFIAVGTPQLEDGNADISQILELAEYIIKSIEKNGVLVIKSTVPVGTGDVIQSLIKRRFFSASSINLLVASNPEFLREGSAVDDFLNADRIIIGGTEEALASLEILYRPLIEKGIPLVKMSRRSAELSKYAANTFLASKISLINYFSQLAEALDANVDEIREGLSYDHRIGPHFLQAGIGYGGSCFPKDLNALKQLSHSLGIDAHLLDATESINRVQKKWIFQQLSRHFAHRSQKLQFLNIGVWGLSFKPGTDDMREASSRVVIPSLIKVGAHLNIYDPSAMSTAKKLWDHSSSISSSITWCNSAEEVLEKKLDALIILTEWDEFKQTSLVNLKIKLKKAPLIDGRNCFDLKKVAQSKINYYSVGRPLIAKDKEFQEEQYESEGN